MKDIIKGCPFLFKYINQIKFLELIEKQDFLDYFGFLEFIDKIYNYKKIDDEYFINILIEAKKYRNFDNAYRYKNIMYLINKYYKNFIDSGDYSFFSQYIQLLPYLNEKIKLYLVTELLNKNYHNITLIEILRKIYSGCAKDMIEKIKTIIELKGIDI